MNFLCGRGGGGGGEIGYEHMCLGKDYRVHRIIIIIIIIIIIRFIVYTPFSERCSQSSLNIMIIRSYSHLFFAKVTRVLSTITS